MCSSTCVLGRMRKSVRVGILNCASLSSKGAQAGLLLDMPIPVSPLTVYFR
jgi:hypothetical protein